MDASDIATVTVTHFPDLEVLARQLRSIPHLAVKVIVDNTADVSSLAAVRALAADITRTFVIDNASNLGLPAALNIGVQYLVANAPACQMVLFLDQDTEPEPESVLQLLWWSKRLETDQRALGAVGPALIDVETGLGHGFHRIDRWRWQRVFPPAGSAPIECDNLNCSGTLMPIRIFSELGGMNESLFMDHTDTDWAFRLRAAGYHLYGVPAAIFRHRMGQSTWRIWLGGWKIWPYRSPSRHFFLFRNAVWLMGRPYVPFVWKFWAVLKLFLTAIIHLVLDRCRWQQLYEMARGVLAAVRSREK